LPTGATPIIGAVFVNTAGTYGHVGVVTGIVNGTTFTTEEMNGGTVWTNRNQGITNEFGHYFPHTRNTGTTMRVHIQAGTQPGVRWSHRAVGRRHQAAEDRLAGRPGWQAPLDPDERDLLLPEGSWDSWP
jgi:surface antigen